MDLFWAAALADFLYFPKIHEQTTQSSRDLTDTIFEFPGRKSPLKAIHMIESVLDRDDPVYWDFLSFCSYLPKSKGIIVNTFEELEPPAILYAIAEGLCKFHALGDVGEGCEFHGVGRSSAFAKAEVSSAAGFGGEAVGEEPVVFQGGLLDEGDFIPAETEQIGGAPDESLIVLAAPEQKPSKISVGVKLSCSFSKNPTENDWSSY